MKFIKDFLDRIKKDHIIEYTASCAYFTFLSFIPFIILLISLIKYINIEQEILIHSIESALQNIATINIVDIIQEAYSKSFETISLSALFMLWSATSGFYSLSLGIINIYKAEYKSSLLVRIKGIIGTILSLFLIIMALILLVFGNSINSIINLNFPMISNFSNSIMNLKSIFVGVFLFIVFLLAYRFIPKKDGNRLNNCVPGAIFTSIRLDRGVLSIFTLCK